MESKRFRRNMLLIITLIIFTYNGQVAFAVDIRVTEGIDNLGNLGITHQAASILNDGKIFVTGGRKGGKSIKSTFIYDPKSDLWTAGHDLPSIIESHSQMTLDDGRVMIIGGRANVREKSVYTTNRVYIIEPYSGTYERKANYPVEASVIELIKKGNKIYGFGGEHFYYSGSSSGYKVVDAICEYDIEKDTWIKRKDLSSSIHFYTKHETKEIATMKNGKLLVVESDDGLQGGRTTVIDLEKNTAVKGPYLPEKLERGALVSVNNDIFFIGGGENKGSLANRVYYSKKTMYRYNQEKNKWEEYMKLPFQPIFYNKPLVDKDKIIFFDGEKWNNNGSGRMEKESEIDNVIIIQQTFSPELTVENSDQGKIYKNNETLTIEGTVLDQDNDAVTIKASIGGITKTTTVENTATSKEWVLSWGTNEIPQGVYENVLFTAVN